MTREEKCSLFTRAMVALYPSNPLIKLSEAIDVDQRTIRRWLTGQRDIPPNVMIDVAGLLGQYQVELRDLAYDLSEAIS